MKVKDIIISAADQLGLDETVEYLKNDVAADTNARESEVNKLLGAFNLTMADICSDYCPLVRSVCFSDTDGILFSNVRDSIVEIVSVTDGEGKNIDFENRVSEIRLNGRYDRVILTYSYMPDARELDDDCDYAEGKPITSRALALGTVAEYLRLTGAYDHASRWAEKFESSLRACMRPKGKIVMPKRRWL